MSSTWLAASGVLRGIVSGVLLLAFVAMWIWVYSARRRGSFEQAARLPLEDDAP